MSYRQILMNESLNLRKEPTTREVATWTFAKRRLSNERTNSILMTHHYPDLGSAFDWLKRKKISFQPIRSTTKIWVVTRHQLVIMELLRSLLRRRFARAQSGDLAKRRLFSQAKR